MQREKAADPDIQLVCDDSNIFKWTALIKVNLARMEKIGSNVLLIDLIWLILYSGTIGDTF